MMRLNPDEWNICDTPATSNMNRGKVPKLNKQKKKLANLKGIMITKIAASQPGFYGSFVTYDNTDLSR